MSAKNLTRLFFATFILTGLLASATVVAGGGGPIVFAQVTATAVDSGQAILLQAVNPAPSSSITYSYEWYNITSGLPVDTGQSGLTYNTLSGVAGQFSYNVVVTDSTGNYSSSNPVTVTVNPVPTFFSFRANQSLIDAGQSVLFSNITTGGTLSPIQPHYLYVYTTNSGLTLIQNTATLAVPGSYSFYETATDNLGVTATSSNVTITVVPPLDILSFTNSTTNSIYSGQSVEFASATSGGTGNFVYTYFVNGSRTTQNSDGSITFLSIGIYNVSLEVTDQSAGSANSVNSIVTVTSAPSTTTTISNGGGGTTAGGVGGGLGGGVPLVTAPNTTTVTTTVPINIVNTTGGPAASTTIVLLPNPNTSQTPASNSSGESGADSGISASTPPSSSNGAGLAVGVSAIAIAASAAAIYYLLNLNSAKGTAAQRQKRK